MIGQLPALLALLVVGAADVPAAGAGAQDPTVTPYAPPPAPPPPPPRNELPISISWIAPDECPAIDALKAEVRRVAGQVPPPPEALSAEATIRRAGAGWQLTLATKTGARAGERKLAGSDCAELMHAAALVMALMINPQASLVVEPPPPPPPPPAPPPTSLPERRFAAGADVVAGSGALPGIAPGVSLRFAAAAGAFSAEVRASIWMSRSAATTSNANAGGSFDLMDAAVAGCAHARRDRRLVPGVCVGAIGLRLHGSGYGVTDPGGATAWSSAALAEANLSIRLTPLNAVRVAAQAVAPIGRPNFALAGVGQVFEPASIWLRGLLGWELHF